MAFANLFKRLSGVEEDVQSPEQGASAWSNVTGRGNGNGHRGNARKKRACSQWAGAAKKVGGR